MNFLNDRISWKENISVSSNEWGIHKGFLLVDIKQTENQKIVKTSEDIIQKMKISCSQQGEKLFKMSRMFRYVQRIALTNKKESEIKRNANV